MTKPHKKDPMPRNIGRKELAKFWDTHSFANYQDELKPAKVRFAKNLSQGITIRFDPQTLDKLRSQAHGQGIGPGTLVRMWILEKLRNMGEFHPSLSSR
jgi:hypothetical protein